MDNRTLAEAIHEIRYLCSDAVSLWGIETQCNHASEECAEFIVALNHYRRGRIKDDEIITEIADVFIMMTEMAHIFGEAEVVAKIKSQTDRMRIRIEAEQIKRIGVKGCQT